MKQKGFTLIEVLAVVTLIAAIALISFPLLTNQTNKSKGKISEASKEIINHSAYTYIDRNQSNYPFTEGNIYCITLRTLVDYGDLKEPLKDNKSGEDIPLTTIVKVSFVSDIDINYEIGPSSCTEVRN